MEKDNEIIYDLTEATADSVAETSVAATPPVENDDNPDCPDTSGSSEKEKSPAENEIDRMIDEVGAETLLEIIRDNRNAAIRQIISEVESSQQSVLRSGVSIAKECNSIFDLAALA